MTYGAKTPTNQLLGERIRYYHDDNNICRYMEDGVTSGHISREKAKENMIYWDEESPKLTMTRKMVIEISKQSDHSLLECLCAVLLHYV